MKVDFSEIADIEDLRAVPRGEYACAVAEVRVSTSPTGHTRWGIRWEVVEGDFQGRTASWDSLHWTERGLPRAKYVLRVLGFEVDGPIEVDASDLKGRKALVFCTPEEREDPLTGMRRLSNRVPYSGYKMISAEEDSREA